MAEAYYNQARKRQLDLLTLVANLGFQEGWITENEKLKIKRKTSLELKKSALFDLLTTAKYDDETAAKLLCALRCVDEIILEPEPLGYSITLAEKYYLSLIMSKLYANRLVTEEQKLIYEKHLQEELVKENVFVEEENVKFQIEDNKNNPAGSNTNPFLITLVINCVLKYLNLKEVKNARYISKVWSSDGLNVLKSRSKIVFSSDDPYSERDSCTEPTPIDFFSTFPIETLETAPFTDFAVYSCYEDNAWDIEDLNYFFLSYKKHIKELEFHVPHLVDENLNRIEKYDISPWLMNSAMTKPNTKYSTRLEILYVPGSTCEISVQLSALLHIKKVSLFNCRVDLQEGILISPTDVEIIDVLFHQNGNLLTKICINDIVDFSKTKEISLFNHKNNPKATKLVLEMGINADIKLETLTLRNITLRNFRACKWTVNLFRWDMPFTESSEMKIRELSIEPSRHPLPHIDIFVLPNSIENLSIEEMCQDHVFCNQPIVLHNIKSITLKVHTKSKILEFLHSQNLKCPNLVELSLESRSREIMEVELTWIPRTLKTLKLKNICIKGEGVDYDLKLDKLVLDEYDIDQVEALCGTHIQTKTLVVCFRSRIWDVADFLHFLENQNICRGSHQRIYAGQFNWKNCSKTGFEKSAFNRYVDREAEYYVFENRMGKAIGYEEFITEQQ